MKSSAEQLFEEINRHVLATDLKLFDYILIKTEPCKIIQINKHKTGKHGCSKITIKAVHFSTRAKGEISFPGSARVAVLEPHKIKYQVIDYHGSTLQLMDEAGNVAEFELPDNDCPMFMDKWGKYMEDANLAVHVNILSCLEYKVLLFV